MALFVYHLYSFASLLLAFETVVVAMVAAVSSHQNETRRGRCFSSVEEALLSSIARVAEAETCAPRRRAISTRLSSSSSSSSFSCYSLISARASRVPSSAFGFPATRRGDSFLTEEEEEEKAEKEEEEEEEDDFLMKTKPSMMMMMTRRRTTTTVAALAEVDSPSCLSLARDQRKTTKVGPTSDFRLFFFPLASAFVLCVFFIFSFVELSFAASDVADPLLHSSNKGKKRTPKSYDVNNCNGYVPFGVFLLLLLLLLLFVRVVVVETSAAKSLQQERKRRLEEEVDYSESRIVVVILLFFFFFFFFFFFGRVFGSARIRY